MSSFIDISGRWCYCDNS